MDNEQKYKEVLQRAKELQDSGSYDKETIEAIFPELKESEESKDEKIRKWIYNRIDTACDIQDEWKRKCLTWLEKQKETLHVPETCKENDNSFTDEQKSVEWSEEDEMMCNTVLSTLNNIGDYGTIEMQKEWLKSLRPQSHWKPSKEQMEALMLAIEGKCRPTSYMSRRLEDLYEGLANTFKVECKLDK